MAKSRARYIYPITPCRRTSRRAACCICSLTPPASAVILLCRRRTLRDGGAGGAGRRAQLRPPHPGWYRCLEEGGRSAGALTPSRKPPISAGSGSGTAWFARFGREMRVSGRLGTAGVRARFHALGAPGAGQPEITPPAARPSAAVRRTLARAILAPCRAPRRSRQPAQRSRPRLSPTTHGGPQPKPT